MVGEEETFMLQMPDLKGSNVPPQPRRIMMVTFGLA